MAQICGIQNHQRSSATINIVQGAAHNTFVMDGGMEFILHELDPPLELTSSSNSNSLLESGKKRGRPRKDSCIIQSSFEASSPSEEDKRLKREQKKLLRMEQKMEKKLMKKLKRSNNQIRPDYNNCEGKENYFHFEQFNMSSNNHSPLPRKRGRPRKFSENDEQANAQLSLCNIDNINFTENITENLDNTGSLTPFQSDLVEAEIFSGITSRNSEEYSIMKNLNLNQVDLKEGCTNEIETAIEMTWTPIQRLVQLNQALAFTGMYKDILFWDRVVAEFTQNSLKFRLDLGTEKSFDVPLLVLSKFFWVCAQLGMQRIQFVFTGLSEKFANDLNDQEGILFNSSNSSIYTHLFNDQILINQRANQLIKFDSSAKITDWTIQIDKFEEFHKRRATTNSASNFEEELFWGIPKRAIEFLDVALVMNSVLTDSISWMTWFYTYVQQTGLRNFSIVELSRPPSPFLFPEIDHNNFNINNIASTTISSVGRGEIEFFEKGRDFIFNVLNTVEVPDIPPTTTEIYAAEEIQNITEPDNNQITETEAEREIITEIEQETTVPEQEQIHEENVPEFSSLTTENNETISLLPKLEESDELEEIDNVVIDVDQSVDEPEEDEDDFFDNYN